METFGTRVRRLRLERGWPSYPAADRASGVPAGTWDNMERKGKDPQLSTIQRIRVAFNVSISELLDDVSGPGAAGAAPVPTAPPDGTEFPRSRRPKRGAK